MALRCIAKIARRGEARRSPAGFSGKNTPCRQIQIKFTPHLKKIARSCKLPVFARGLENLSKRVSRTVTVANIYHKRRKRKEKNGGKTENDADGPAQ
jgi:hypothetical protein